jgi:hypothetical protein
MSSAKALDSLDLSASPWPDQVHCLLLCKQTMLFASTKKQRLGFQMKGQEEEMSVSTILLLPLGSLKQQTFYDFDFLKL